MKLHMIPPDCTEIEWRKAADTVYMIARCSSKAQGIPSHVLEAQRDVLHAAFVRPADEQVKPSPLGVQFGASDSADFSAGTWAFTMHNDWKVAAGEFAIMPREMYHRLFNQAARPTAPAGQLGEWLEIDDIDELADRYGDHDQKNDCYSFNREGLHSVRALVAEVMRRRPSTPAAPNGYVIAHVDGKRWRTLDGLGMPDWTDDITKALCVTLAEHAHAYAAEDPEDVRILPRGLPELHPTLVESVGQAIHDEIVENGAEDLDWHDSREVDRVARAAVKAMRRFLDSISQPREVDARNSLLEEIADARDNLMNVGHHDDAVAAMGKALNWIEGEPSTELDDGGRPGPTDYHRDIGLTREETEALLDIVGEGNIQPLTLGLCEMDGIYGLHAGPTNHTDEVWKLIKALPRPENGGWIAADDVLRHVKAIDDALNGIGSAERPLLVDVSAQIQREAHLRRRPLIECLTPTPNGPYEVMTGFDGQGFEAPEAWDEKPFCRIGWYEDGGDPSVGIQGVSGWMLVDDQSGTVVADLAARSATQPAGGAPVFHIGAQNDTLYIIKGEPPAAAMNDYPRHDADRTAIARVLDEALARELVSKANAGNRLDHGTAA